MKETLKMTAALVLFATAACVALAFVYEGTKETIAGRQKAELEAALKALFPEAEAFDDISAEFLLKTAGCGTDSGGASVTFYAAYAAKLNGETIGTAVRASSAGFSDDITALVGVSQDGKLAGVKILAISDTPGLGANAVSPNYFVDKANRVTFLGQFAAFQGKMAVKQDGGEVTAITAATITSRAVTKIASEAAAAVTGEAAAKNSGN